MKLTFEKIKAIVNGAARITEENGVIHFCRFTDAQEQMYKQTNDGFYQKTLATAGIRLEFTTDSRRLFMAARCFAGSSRTYFNHDIYVNGEHRWSLGGNLKGADGIAPLTVSGEYDLGDGDKTVKIYFPWSVGSELISLELDDGATVTPVSHSCKMILFGDSITHGYDTVNPSHSYASRLVDALDAFAINKGIGGEVFRPELARLADSFTPDYITVAYGTNDWNHQKGELFERFSEEFYTSLATLYPTARIFAFSPIWRGDRDRITDVGAFSHVLEKLCEIAAGIPTMTVIDCTDLIPHTPEMFSPDVLHPNDNGFSYYSDGLIKSIKSYI